MLTRKTTSEIAANRGIYLEVEIDNAKYTAHYDGLREGLLTCIEFYLEEEYGSDGRDVMPRVHALDRIEDLRRFYYMLVRAGCFRDAVRYLPQLPVATS